MAKVFLSYDHDDVVLARPIAAALEKAGHIVWYDRHIHGGAQYSRKIEQALDAADAVVVLWSPRSLDSAWVRDEAAEGRDRGKLVPLCVEQVTPPMGFRQFQTIELGAWKGRGKVPQLTELLEAIRNQAEDSGPETSTAPPRSARLRTPQLGRRSIMAAGAAILFLLAAFAAWTWLNPRDLPVVTVEAANESPRSQAAASDLFVKLGSLAEIGEGKWQLVDSGAEASKANLVFRTADTGSVGQPKANLVLLDGKDGGLLWSREFEFPAGGQADLRQQLSLTAGRVLGCALESREAGGLPRDLLKLFLNACAMLVETGNTADTSEPESIARPLRAVVKAKPRFEPAWSRLIIVDSMLVDMAANSGGDRARLLRQLRTDIEKAREVAPDLPALALAELNFLPPNAYEQRLNLLAKAAAQAPDNPDIFSTQVGALQGVGRMGESIAAARRAGELDPLSPVATTQVIMALAYAGQLDRAKLALAEAERLWAGTGALRDIQWGFHLRYGDPQMARKLAPFGGEGLTVYLAARADPSEANVGRLVALLKQRKDVSQGDIGSAIQALAEFGQTDELLRWLAGAPTEGLASASYLLFRPAFAEFRRDPRFMALAGRIGLADYWLSTGEWPDYCSEPALPYDCKREAAKHVR
ncbi:MAG TPA: TIR domain-containing protein [Sphingomicrobium sp.]|nr:TIR domain-containing protein [Sphingomicrobium sp.]